MLPLSLLRAAVGQPVLVELKNGETYNGHLVSIDQWMNMQLREVVCTARDGDRFWSLQEIQIRGNTIKYCGVPDEVLDVLEAEDKRRREQYKQQQQQQGQVQGGNGGQRQSNNRRNGNMHRGRFE